MGLNDIEIRKIKIEMLEKEANLNFKQIVFFVTAVGAIASFLIHNSFSIDLSQKLTLSEVIIFVVNLLLALFLIAKLIFWLLFKLNRLEKLNKKIGELNDDY